MPNNPPTNGFMATFIRILLTSLVTVSVAMAGWLYSHTASRIDRLEEAEKQIMLKLGEINAKLDLILQERHGLPPKPSH